jgi:hypothetical protein
VIILDAGLLAKNQCSEGPASVEQCSCVKRETGGTRVVVLY